MKTIWKGAASLTPIGHADYAAEIIPAVLSDGRNFYRQKRYISRHYTGRWWQKLGRSGPFEYIEVERSTAACSEAEAIEFMMNHGCAEHEILDLVSQGV